MLLVNPHAAPCHALPSAAELLTYWEQQFQQSDSYYSIMQHSNSRGRRTKAIWALTRVMLFALAVYIASCTVMISRDTKKGQQLLKAMQETERKLLDLSHATEAVVHAVQHAVHSPPPVSEILAVIPTCKRDLYIARTSKLWRGDTIQALFLLAEQEPLTAAEEAQLAAEGVTVSRACC
jgi:hypothetical protein